MIRFKKQYEAIGFDFEKHEASGRYEKRFAF